MLEAPTLDHVLNHSQKKDTAACCILLAPSFSKVGKDEVIPRIGYLDNRSGQSVHFYCAGYGGYWHPSTTPDMQQLGEVKYDNGSMIPWAFSQKLFSEFVDRFELETSWRYSGNTELIFLGPKVDFSNALILNIDAMVHDGGIVNSAELFEAVIRYCRDANGNPSAYDFSDRMGAKELGKGALEGLLELLPKAVQDICKKGQHYMVRSIAA